MENREKKDLAMSGNVRLGPSGLHGLHALLHAEEEEEVAIEDAKIHLDSTMEAMNYFAQEIQRRLRIAAQTNVQNWVHGQNGRNVL